MAPVNTGVPSGMDLNNDGEIGGGDDAYGFGLFPGQYGMVVYSKHPILTEQIRTFQHFRWKDMPARCCRTTRRRIRRRSGTRAAAAILIGAVLGMLVLRAI